MKLTGFTSSFNSFFFFFSIFSDGHFGGPDTIISGAKLSRITSETTKTKEKYQSGQPPIFPFNFPR